MLNVDTTSDHFRPECANIVSSKAAILRIQSKTQIYSKLYVEDGFTPAAGVAV